MSDEEDAYLQDDFNPTKLSINKLRGILNKHDIHYSSAVSRKAQFVELFNTEIVPRRAQYRAQLAGVNPSGSGIEDAPPSPTRRARSRGARINTPPPADLELPEATKSPRRSTRARSPTRKAASLTAQEPVLSAPKLEPEAATEPAVAAAPAASPRRGRSARTQELAAPPTLKHEPMEPEEKGPRTRARSRSPVRRPEQDQVLQSPRRRRLAKDLKQDSTLNDSERSSQLQPAIPEEEILASAPKQLKRTSKVLDASEERPKKVPALPAGKDAAPAQQESRGRSTSSRVPSLSNAVPQLLPAQVNVGAQSAHTAPELDDIDVVEQYTNFADEEGLNDAEEFVQEFQQEAEQDDRSFLTSSSHHTESATPARLTAVIPSLSVMKASNKFAEQLDDIATPSEAETEILRDTLTPAVEDETVENDEDTTEAVEQELLEQHHGEAAENAEANVVDGHAGQIIFDGVFKFFRILAFVGLLSVLVWWRQEKLKLDICETNGGYHPYPETLFQDFGDPNIEYLQEIAKEAIDRYGPQCSPCPEHAECLGPDWIQCHDGYLLLENPLHFGGVLPLYPRFYCSRNLEWEHRLQGLTDKAAWILHERRALVECRSTDKPAAIDEDELRQVLYGSKIPHMSDREFDELWQQVMIALAEDAEIEVQWQTDTSESKFQIQSENEEGSDIAEPVPKAVYLSHSLKNLSLVCTLRYKVYTWLEENRLLLIQIGVGISALLILSVIIAYFWTREVVIRRICNDVVVVLKAQSETADNDTTGLTVRHVTVRKLRNLVGSNVSESLWNTAIGRLRYNFYVKANTLEVAGEISPILEWSDQ